MCNKNIDAGKTDIEIKEICQKTCELARRVGRHIWGMRQSQGLVIETKGRHDYVTQMDKLSEQMLVGELEILAPAAGFITEEQTRTERGESLNWVVDPIDGTTNFIHGQPPFAISIALLRTNADKTHDVLLGVVYEMSRDELFCATLGGGAYLNGTPIHVSDTPFDQALVATGFPYNDFSLADSYMPALREMMEGAAGVRRLGSAATDLAYVAAGRNDAFFEYDLKPWDVAAGCLLVTEAGGRLSDFDGGQNYIFGRQMVASNAAARDTFFGKVNKHLGNNKQEA